MIKTSRSFKFCTLALFTLTSMGFFNSAHATSVGSTTTVTGSPNPAGHNILVTFVATVTSGNTITSGTVTFKDAGSTIGTVNVNTGSTTETASFSTSTLSVGTHSITATYNGIPADINASPPSAAYSEVITATPTPTPVPTATPTAATPVAPTASQNAAKMQGSVTKSISLVTNQVVSSGIGNAISSGFADSGGGFASMQGAANGFSFNYDLGPSILVASNGDVVLPTLQNPQPNAPSAPSSHWNAWIDVRNSGWSNNADSASSDLSGNQLNITGGVGHRLSEDLLVGILLGYEHSSYDSAALASNLSDNGSLLGVYLGYRVAGNITADVAVTWAKLSYTSTSSGDTGTFDSNRFTFSGGFTGNYAYHAFLIDPSIHLKLLTEKQDAWIDSLGTSQSEQKFAGGEVSAGAKVLYPLDLSATLSLKPYVGIFSDNYWANSTVTGSWSATATAGADAMISKRWSVGLGGELYGIGVSYKAWAVNASASLQF